MIELNPVRRKHTLKRDKMPRIAIHKRSVEIEQESRFHLARSLRHIRIGVPNILALSTPKGDRRSLHCRSDLPRGELRIAISQEFRLRPLARSDRENLFEDLLALVGNRDAVKNVAAIDVHVFDHPAVRVIVGGKLDRRGWLAAVSRPASGGEAEDVGAAGDLSSCR